MEQGPGLGEQAVCLGHLGLTLAPGHRVTDQGQCSGTLTGQMGTLSGRGADRLWTLVSGVDQVGQEWPRPGPCSPADRGEGAAGGRGQDRAAGGAG